MMVERVITIKNRAGLHTRPAATLVKTAAAFQSDFSIQKDSFEINGKSIIGVMTLAAEQGSTLTLRFEGPDEEAAAAAVVDLFERGFDEQ
jgi:phosphocarrier protein